MAVVRVRTSSVYDVSAGTTIELTLSASPASGNALIVAVMIESTTITVDSVTSSPANTFTNDYGPNTVSHGGAEDAGRLYFFRCLNITNSPTTVTANLSGSTIGAVVAWEVSGLRATSPLNATVHSGTAVFSADGTFSQAFTTDFADEIAFFYTGQANGATGLTPGSGWTNDYNSTFSSNFLSRILTSSGSFNADGDYDVAVNTNETIVSYRGLASSIAPIAMHLSKLMR